MLSSRISKQLKGFLLAAGLMLMSALALAESVVTTPLILTSQLQVEPKDAPLAPEDWHWLRQKHQLVLGVPTSGFVPLDIVFNDQEFEGITADVSALLAQILNIKVLVVALPDRRSGLAALASGQIDLLSTSNSFERSDPRVVLSQPYAKDWPTLFRRKGDLRMFPDDLKGLTITTPVDYLQLSDLQARFPAAKIVSMSSPMNAMAAMAFGTADLYLGDNLSAYSMINQSSFNNDVQFERFLDLDSTGFSYAMRQDDPVLQRIIDTALKALGDDKLQSIVKRWTGGDVALADGKLTLTPQETRWVQRHPVVRLAINDDMAPVAFFNSDGHFSGMVADLLETFSRRTGLQFEVSRKSSLSGLMEALKKNQADMTILTPNAERETYLRFTRPFVVSSFALVTRPTPGIPTVDLNSLHGKRLVIAKEHVLFNRIKTDHPTIQLVTASSTLDAMNMVADGKADAMIMALAIARYNIARFYDQKLKVVNIIDNGQATGNFAMRRSDTELQSILDKTLLSIPPDELLAISNRWRANASMSGQTWFDYRGVIAWIVLGALLTLLMALGWIRHLRRQINQRRRAEQALNEQLQLMQTLTDGMPHPVYVVDRDERMLSCNDRYLQAVGLTRPLVLGKTRPQIIEEQHAGLPDLRESCIQAMAEDLFFTTTCTLQHAGKTRWIDYWIQPFHDASGEVKGALCGWLDITEHRQALNELETAKNIADEASRSKTTFLAAMSHEIRTPMSAVIGTLELALKRGEQGTCDQAGIEIAYASARSLLGLIGDILDIARIESGRLSLSPKRANLRELMESVVQVFEGLSLQKGLELHLDIDSSTHCDVLVDPMRFKQVLSNLLSNAIKFTCEGSVKIQIRGEVLEPARLSVHLLIEDSGIGISDADQKKLFKPFAQAAEGAHKGQDGAGLGLLISRSLCELMGGRLSMSSVRGQGTRVEVELRLNILEPVEQPALAGTRSLPAPLHSCNVLVVDDHAVNREILRQQMVFLGHQVVEADNGSVALDKWRKGEFDVVITDCHMPLLSGPELARAIRREEHEQQLAACVIMGLTADAQPEELERCIDAGMNDCLIKPAGLDLLAERMAATCRAVRPTRETPPPLGLENISPVDHDLLYDLAPLDELTRGDQPLMNHLVLELLASNRKDLEDLIQMVEERDTVGLCELGHRIKGAARVVTANRLIHCCEQLERVAAQQVVPYSVLLEAGEAVEQAMFDLEQALTPAAPTAS